MCQEERAQLHIPSKLPGEMTRLAEEREETQKKPKLSAVTSAQSGGGPLCTVDM